MLQALVEHHHEQVELRRQLAELLVFAERGNEAVRHFRICIPQLQEAGQREEAEDVLMHLTRCAGRKPEIERAAELLAEDIPINWQSIRDDLTAQQVKKLEDEGAEGGSRRRTDAVQVQDESGSGVEEELLDLDDGER